MRTRWTRISLGLLIGAYSFKARARVFPHQTVSWFCVEKYSAMLIKEHNILTGKLVD